MIWLKVFLNEILAECRLPKKLNAEVILIAKFMDWEIRIASLFIFRQADRISFRKISFVTKFFTITWVAISGVFFSVAVWAIPTMCLLLAIIVMIACQRYYRNIRRRSKRFSYQSSMTISEEETCISQLWHTDKDSFLELWVNDPKTWLYSKKSLSVGRQCACVMSSTIFLLFVH